MHFLEHVVSRISVVFPCLISDSHPERTHTVKKLLAFFCLLCLALTGTAKNMKIYEGSSSVEWNCIATYEDGKLYKGSSPVEWNCIATYEKGYFYKGASTAQWNCQANYQDNHLNREWHTAFHDILATYEDGRIYKGAAPRSSGTASPPTRTKNSTKAPPRPSGTAS